MKFAYTIWHEKHFKNIDELIRETQDVVDSYIITTMPLMPKDNDPNFSIPLDELARINNAIEKCKGADKEVVLQVIPTPQDSRGKTPKWWQGWIYFNDEANWKLFFQNFMKAIEAIVSPAPGRFTCDKLLLGAEMVSTLSKKNLWSQFVYEVKLITGKEVGYSHHFSLPLKHYYNWQLSLTVLFGYLFFGKNVYGKLLDKLLVEPFYVPAKQLNQYGKNFYHAPMINQADIDFVKLNDYFWYVMDDEYTEVELRQQWEKAKEDGITIEFMPAVRSWAKKYCKGKELWIENDLNIGYTNCSDKYYKMWWEIFLDKHESIADVIVVWDNGNFKRWAKVIRKIKKL